MLTLYLEGRKGEFESAEPRKVYFIIDDAEAELLRRTDATLVSISQEVGTSNSQSVTGRFRRVYVQSDQQVRERQRLGQHHHRRLKW